MQKKSVVNVVGSMMVITLLGKIMGMLRDVIFASAYGTGTIEAAAFLTASRIPRLFFDAMFASAISASFIPIFNEQLKKKGKEAAYRFSDNFITIVFIITLILTVFAGLFSGQTVQLFADGFDENTAQLCEELLVVLFPMLIFTGIAYVFTGILQSFDEFKIPAAMSIVSNGIIILYFIFFDKYFGIFGLAAAFLLGWLMQAVIQIPSLYKNGYHYRPRVDLKDEALKKVGILMMPVMVSTWVQPINVAINTKFASHIPDGIAALDYANNLYTIITGVLVLSVANIIFPNLSRLTEEKDKEEFGKVLGVSLRSIFFLLIPMMVGLMVLSEPIIRVIYERGEFTAHSTHITAEALKYFSIGMLGYGMQNILNRGFFAVQDGKTPLATGIISIAINLILSMFLVERMEISGLALASALSALVSGILLLIPMNKKFGNIIDLKTFLAMLKMFLSAGVMAVGVYGTYNGISEMLSDGFIFEIMNLGISVSVGVILYMFMAWILKIEEIDFVKNMINKILKK